MLNHDLRHDDGIPVLNPGGPLEAADFTTLTGHVDAYLEQQGKLRGVLIRAKSFPGWKDFGALLAHLKFVKAHHQGTCICYSHVRLPCGPAVIKARPG